MPGPLIENNEAPETRLLDDFRPPAQTTVASTYAYAAIGTGRETDAEFPDPGMPQFLQKLRGDDPERYQIAKDVYAGPAPAFVTGEWVRTKILSTGQIVRAIDREWNRNTDIPYSFAEWPKDAPPSEVEFREIVARLFQIGGGIFALYKVAKRVKPKLSFRGIFKPFEDFSQRQLFSVKQGPREFSSTAGFQIRLRELSGSHPTWVRDFLVVEAAHGMSRIDWAGIAKSLGGEFAELVPYLNRMEAAYSKFPDIGQRLKQLRNARAQVPQPEPLKTLYGAEFIGLDDPTVAAPEIKPPGFVTVQWMRDKLALSGHMKSDLHQLRDELRLWADNRDFWPEAQPETGRVEDAILKSLALPFVLHGINARGGSERSASVFRPFYRKVEAILNSVVQRKPTIYDPDVLSNDADILDALVAEGFGDMAKAFAVLRGSELIDVEDLLDVIRGVPDYGDVERYLTDRIKRIIWTKQRSLAPKGIELPNFDVQIQEEDTQVKPFSAYEESLADGEVTSIATSMTQETTATVVHSAPTIDASAIQREVDSAELNYRIAIESLVNESMEALASTPDADVVLRIRVRVGSIQEAVDSYLAAVARLPKGVEIASLVDRLSALQSRLAILAGDLEETLPPIEFPEHARTISEHAATHIAEMAEDAERSLASAEATRGKVNALMGQIQALGSSMVAAVKIQVISDQIKAEIPVLQSHFSTASDLLGSAAEVLRRRVEDFRQTPDFPKTVSSADAEHIENLSPSTPVETPFAVRPTSNKIDAPPSEELDKQDIAEVAPESVDVGIDAEADVASARPDPEVSTEIIDPPKPNNSDASADNDTRDDASAKSWEDGGSWKEFDALSEEEVAALTASVASATLGADVDDPLEIAGRSVLSQTNDVLQELFLEGEFGLAFHLATAVRESYPEMPLALDPEVARFASLAGNLNHASLHGNVDTVRLWVRRLMEKYDPELRRNEFDDAVRLLLIPSVLELSLFHPNSGALEVARTRHRLDLGIREFHSEAEALLDAIERMGHNGNIALTQAVLASVENEMDCGAHSAKLSASIRESIERFGKMRFNFELGNKIRNALLVQDHDLGKLSAALERQDQNSVEVARKFVEESGSRQSIVDMLERAEVRLNSARLKGLDGPARNKIIAEVIRVRDQAARYVEMREEMNEVRERERPKIREWVSDLRRHLSAFIAVVASRADGSALGRACKLASEKLRAADDLLAGRATSISSSDYLLNLHGSLSFLPDLHFGRSWFPTPYSPSTVIASIQSASLPLLSSDRGQRDAEFRIAIRRRFESYSLSAARLMIGVAPQRGVSAQVVEEAEVSLNECLKNGEDELKERIDAVRSRIDRVLRFAAVSNKVAEQAEDLRRQTDKIERADVFRAIVSEERLESPEKEQISDAHLAFQQLDDMFERAGHLLSEPREGMIAKIDKLADRLSEPDIQRLMSLVADDDFHTAEEFIEIAETIGELPAAGGKRTRFKIFADDVLPDLVNGKATAGQALEAIIRRTDFCGIPFSGLTDARAQESQEILKLWIEIRNRLSAMREGNLTPNFMSLLEKMGLDPAIKPKASNPTKRIYVADSANTLKNDQEGLLLPDFGSRAEGHRLVLTDTMPSDGALAEMLLEAGSFTMILFVADFVQPRRRAQLLASNVRGKRKVILVDTASLLFALGEPALRALTLFELGQPYSYVAPFKDWGRDAVPPEMFIGRVDDINEIRNAEGSCIVYGGRRMGKTALLRHIKLLYDQPDKGTHVGYIDAQDPFDKSGSLNRIWQVFSEGLPAIFPGPAPHANADQKKVIDGITDWLKKDRRRRVLLLIDESDKFVVSDAAQDYQIFRALQQLMTDTQRRFKFVLSGLANVTRLGQIGNSPLKHVAANPRRIGPLMGRELNDAEDLMVHPFSAIGVEFERREDVWKILSHSNYYPVLIQTYGQLLLDDVLKRFREDDGPTRRIPSKWVSDVLDDQNVRLVIKEIFMNTLRIDRRYQLIAYAIAYDMLGADSEGKLQNGISIRQIREAAVYWWPEGFAEKNRISLFEDLLDEMEGLGIVRRLEADRWSLRSSAVLRLLGNRDEISNGLEDFLGLGPPRERDYDPKSLRRMLDAKPRRSSPLTLSQEREILRDTTSVHVVLGSEIADVSLVAGALRSAPESFSEATEFEVDVLKFATKEELLERVRKSRGPASPRLTVVVTPDSPWNATWVFDCLRVRVVADGRVKVVFIGNPDHVESIVADARLQRALPGLKITALEPWSDAYAEHTLKRSDLIWDDVKKEAGVQVGGWNAPMSRIADRVGGLPRGDRTAVRLAKIVSETAASAELPFSQVVRGKLRLALVAMAKWQTNSTFRIEDVDAVLEMDGLASDDFKGQEAVTAGVLLGLISPSATQGAEDDRRVSYMLTEFAQRLLNAPSIKAAE